MVGMLGRESRAVPGRVGCGSPNTTCWRAEAGSGVGVSVNLTSSVSARAVTGGVSLTGGAVGPGVRADDEGPTAVRVRAADGVGVWARDGVGVRARDGA